MHNFIYKYAYFIAIYLQDLNRVSLCRLICAWHRAPFRQLENVQSSIPQARLCTDFALPLLSAVVRSSCETRS